MKMDSILPIFKTQTQQKQSDEAKYCRLIAGTVKSQYIRLVQQVTGGQGLL